MRSPMLFLSIVSLAIAGCGKSVDRTARPASQSVVQPQTTMPGSGSSNGNCVDPVLDSYSLKRVEKASDLAESGVYELRTLITSGIYPAGTGVPTGTSVLEISQQAGGAYAITRACHDLNSMPNGQYNWKILAPFAMSASGLVANHSEVKQTVYGPDVLAGQPPVPRAPEGGPSTVDARQCNMITQLLEDDRCGVKGIYMPDSRSLSILRRIERNEGGAIVISKVYATYELVGGPTPGGEDPSNGGGSSKKKKKGGKDEKDGKGSQGKGGQGDTGNIENNSNNGNANNSNNGNNSNNSNNGNNEKKTEKKADKKDDRKSNSNNGNSNHSNNSGNSGNSGNDNWGKGEQGKGGQGVTVIYYPANTNSNSNSNVATTTTVTSSLLTETIPAVVVVEPANAQPAVIESVIENGGKIKFRDKQKVETEHGRMKSKTRMKIKIK